MPTQSEAQPDLVQEVEDLLAKVSRQPWTVGRVSRRRSAAHVWVKTRAGAIVADVRNIGPITSDTEYGSETTESNAALIAAAPDLLRRLVEEVKRLRAHAADLDHDLEATVRHCKEYHEQERRNH